VSMERGFCGDSLIFAGGSCMLGRGLEKLFLSGSSEGVFTKVY
jgi:hypothetical protein